MAFISKYFTNREPGRESDGRQRSRRILIFLIVLMFLAASIGGILTGKWLVGKRSAADRYRLIDEYQGLGERTGLTGELGLSVNPVRLNAYVNQPIMVELILTNNSKKNMTLNGWLTPAPASFNSNQLPLKVLVTKNGRNVGFHGNMVLFPPHEKDDFFTLGPGERKSIHTNLLLGPGNGKWDVSVPGVYNMEIWYESYLTRIYAGSDAWTGMSNHVIVQAIVYPENGVSR